MTMMHTRRRFLQIMGLLLILPACQKKQRFTRLPKGSKVVALGDSLTVGYGAKQDYPALLEEKTGWRVINTGVNGDTSSDVLARLDDVIALKPQLVLLGVGGNDVLQRVPASTTSDNLTAIIEQLLAEDIAVVLIAEPHLSASALLGRARDNPIYKTVASSTGVPLFADEWSKILSDDALKSDQIHANEQGYAQFAQHLYQFLQELGYAI